MDTDRLDKVLRHINHVKDDCIVLGEKLILADKEDLGRKLIANGYIHDNSKLNGIEWLYLHDEVKDKEPELFFLAVNQHQQNNPHHSEYWSDINEMPTLYLAEMCADWKARANEFGTDLREWIKDKATDKYKFTTKGRVYKDIMYFCNMLLEPLFKSQDKL